MAKKIKGFTAKTILAMLGCTLIFTLLFAIVPLISLSSKSYELVAADAARAFGIQEHEYVVEFLPRVTNAQGRSVQGLYTAIQNPDGTITHHIQIRVHHLRVMTIGTIFHEFAHAAQVKFNLSSPSFNIEQHAEIMSFSAMRNSGYWWYSLHLLTFHTFFAKPAEYRVPSYLWQIALGAPSASAFSLPIEEPIEFCGNYK